MGGGEPSSGGCRVGAWPQGTLQTCPWLLAEAAELGPRRPRQRAAEPQAPRPGHTTLCCPSRRPRGLPASCTVSFRIVTCPLAFLSLELCPCVCAHTHIHATCILNTQYLQHVSGSRCDAADECLYECHLLSP